MPEGDTIFRSADTLHRALAGRRVTRFTSVLPRLTRIDAGEPIAGRTIDRVESRGKHLLIWFSGDLVLRTHMRMHGSWHIYRPGERWQRPHRDMRITIETAAMHAVAFNVPVAELVSSAALLDSPAIRDLGPDLLSPAFDPDEAATRLQAQPAVAIADALLDQRCVAGIGNVYKSELLFLARIDPFTPVGRLDHAVLVSLLGKAARLLRANVARSTPIRTRLRRTTLRDDPAAALWVYGRAGRPCRRCGTPVASRKHGADARITYWCERCQ